jgi:hypothetical protein
MYAEADRCTDAVALGAEEEARASVLALLAACERNRSWSSIAAAADAAYLKIGVLAVLARAASNR